MLLFLACVWLAIASFVLLGQYLILRAVDHACPVVTTGKGDRLK